MLDKPYEYEIKRKIAMPNGGSLTVTVGSPEPIDEAEFRILNPQNAIAMAKWAIDFAEILKPKGAGDAG